MEALEFVATEIRSLLQRLPSGVHGEVSERTGDEIEQLDDYAIDWQLAATPTNPLSCPIDVIGSRGPAEDCSWGFAFDSRGRIATRLGLKLGHRTHHIVGFGAEPTPMPPDRAVAIVKAVIQGQVALHYRVFSGFLTKTAGIVSIPGNPHRFWGYGLPVGVRKVFQYMPWSQAA